MARADRQDAREEKRKKELEKERHRVENMRKREEKDHRDRTARQKMLAEGRITVEDTWGKVTPSQPRLNRFFGGKAVVTPVKRKNMRDIEEDEDEDAVNDQTLVEVYNGQGQQKTATLFKIYDEQEQKATTPTNTELSARFFNIHGRADTLPPSPSSSARTRECSSPLDKTKDVPIIAEDTETKEGLIESFTSVFNEIDDDDLIALVEEVEADISTPRTADYATPKNRTDMALALPFPHDETPPSVNTDKRQQHTTSEVSSRIAEARGPPVTGMPPPPPPRPQPRPSLGSSRRLRDSIPKPPPPPPPKIGPGTQTTSTGQRQTTQQEQGSSSRILPWNDPLKKHHYAIPIPADDFGAPGPSTQALMVELVEQVEAQIDAHALR
jgi:hypothetical protein